MARISPLTLEEAPPATYDEWDRQVIAHGRMTHMKRTLARSPVALETYMRWYPLKDEVEKFLGPRLTLLFAHAISTETDCLICSTYFRRHLVETGEDPDDLKLDERDEDIVALGRQIAKDPHGVDDELYQRACRHLDAEGLVAVTAFAGLMVATNIFNNTLRVDLDSYLDNFRETT
jgi:alkylhydroperoxidase family enzyme